MPISTNINSYNDVHRVLARMLVEGGGRVRVSNKGKAVHWRQRAYKLRKLIFEQQLITAGDPVGYVPTTPYDDMILSLQELPSGEVDVVVEFRVIAGKVLSLDGLEELEFSHEAKEAIMIDTEQEEDELLIAAKNLVDEKGVDDND